MLKGKLGTQHGGHREEKQSSAINNQSGSRSLGDPLSSRPLSFIFVVPPQHPDVVDFSLLAILHHRPTRYAWSVSYSLLIALPLASTFSGHRDPIPTAITTLVSIISLVHPAQTIDRPQTTQRTKDPEKRPPVFNVESTAISIATKREL